MVQPRKSSKPDQDVTLKQLSDAFEQMLTTEGGETETSEQLDDQAPRPDVSNQSAAAENGEVFADDGCPVTPSAILEAMLFVGHPENVPLERQQAAEIIHGMEPDEIDELVGQLNSEYEAAARPYTIVGDGTGYRLALRDEYSRVRDNFYGRAREAKLSQAAIEVLALVAYNQPLTNQAVSKLRGRPSGALLTQLVRRQLLRIERPEKKPRTPKYFTTPRFLNLFGLGSLDDLPRNQDFGP